MNTHKTLITLVTLIAILGLIIVISYVIGGSNYVKESYSIPSGTSETYQPTFSQRITFGFQSIINSLGIDSKKEATLPLVDDDSPGLLPRNITRSNEILNPSSTQQKDIAAQLAVIYASSVEKNVVSLQYCSADSPSIRVSYGQSVTFNNNGTTTQQLNFGQTQVSIQPNQSQIVSFETIFGTPIISASDAKARSYGCSGARGTIGTISYFPPSR